ncbi:hypothetical protein Nepgr_017534 [Nepenthes gracilis]|uniref:PWWP domain-containing protein n=1 Tax=Nepenthes gracilis TaxID=150966 RepID=A0AAD3SPJ1_NEPGR|nr:hypothetical protein Nepgr_017534 [Nepenthes gracilis]
MGESQSPSPAIDDRPEPATGGGDVTMDEARMCFGGGVESRTNGLPEMPRGFNDTGDAVEVQEHAEISERVADHEGQNVDEEQVSSEGKSLSKEEKNAKPVASWSGNSVKDYQATYHLPLENESDFSVSDLVWGKVKSHPWWPGQIFNPSDSSEKAIKYFRKDCYLVAYFGDRTFAWNDTSLLKPFRKYFSQEEKQSNSEAFQNAVSCALKEVSRRVEVGLACSCIPEEVYDEIKFQIIENTGIRQESSKREGADGYASVDSFQPYELIEYIRALAESPTAGFNRLDVVITKAQLLAFYRLKGYYALPELQLHGALLESDIDSSLPQDLSLSSGIEHVESIMTDNKVISSDKDMKGPHRRKHKLKDIFYHKRKEKSLSELMGETMTYLDSEYESDGKDSSMLISQTSGRKRKALGSLTDDSMVQENTRTISLAKVLHRHVAESKQTFKVGECIRRAASQLAGSPIILKGNGDGSYNKRFEDDFDELDSPSEKMIVPVEDLSLDELLAELHLAAQDPLKGYSFSNAILSFFLEFRNSVVSTRICGKEYSSKGRDGPGRKGKSSRSIVESPKPFEFDDVNDSYWTDMVVEHSSEDKNRRRGRKRKDQKLVADDLEKPLQTIQSSPRMNSRRRYYHESIAVEPSWDERKPEQLPTELILNFTEVDSFPSELNLNKMFRRFGPLRESETEIDRETSRARVVFKRCSDAEVAYSSAATFNIFGRTLVNYQLNYAPSISFKSSPSQ